MDDVINSTILASMNDGVFVVDFNGRILFINRAASELLHIGETEITEKSFKELFMMEAENDAFNDILFNGIQNREVRAYCEVPFRRSDGKRIELAVTSSFLRNNEGSGQGSGIVLVFKDITASKALDLARQRVLDHLSHELRTPLTIVKATLKRVIGPDDVKIGERIEHNLKRLEEIQLAVNDIVQKKNVEEKHQAEVWVQQMFYLLDILAEENKEYASTIDLVKNEVSRLLGEHYFHSQPIDIMEELTNAVGQARTSARHRFVSLHLKSDVEAKTWIDRQVLNKAFLTLIKNAIEATPDGGDVAVSATQKEDCVVVEVKDTGIGITPESQAQIFGGFYHARETDLYSTKKPYDFGAGGKGLELLRLKIFSELFQFNIEYESRRCVHIPDESLLCPGSIETCSYVKNAGECAEAGGTSFRLKFRRLGN